MRKIMLCTHWPLWRSPATEQYFRMQYDSEHYSHVIMSAMASQFAGVSIVYSTVCSGADQKHQSSASMAFMRGIRRWPVNSPQKGPVTRKMFPFDDVIISCICWPTAAGIGLVNDKHIWQIPCISLRNITKSNKINNKIDTVKNVKTNPNRNSLFLTLYIIYKTQGPRARSNVLKLVSVSKVKII